MRSIWGAADPEAGRLSYMEEKGDKSNILLDFGSIMGIAEEEMGRFPDPRGSIKIVNDIWSICRYIHIGKEKTRDPMVYTDLVSGYNKIMLPLFQLSGRVKGSLPLPGYIRSNGLFIEQTPTTSLVGTATYGQFLMRVSDICDKWEDLTHEGVKKFKKLKLVDGLVESDMQALAIQRIFAYDTLDLGKLKGSVRMTDEMKDLVEMSKSLNDLKNQDSIQSQLMAFNKLQTIGIKVPKILVPALQPTERMTQAIANIAIDSSEMTAIDRLIGDEYKPLSRASFVAKYPGLKCYYILVMKTNKDASIDPAAEAFEFISPNNHYDLDPYFRDCYKYQGLMTTSLSKSVGRMMSNINMLYGNQDGEALMKLAGMIRKRGDDAVVMQYVKNATGMNNRDFENFKSVIYNSDTFITSEISNAHKPRRNYNLDNTVQTIIERRAEKIQMRNSGSSLAYNVVRAGMISLIGTNVKERLGFTMTNEGISVISYTGKISGIER
jgi:hypothetical protein